MRGVDDALTVGGRIAFHRVRRGLTQQQLGVLVGRSTEWVSSIERGRRQVRSGRDANLWRTGFGPTNVAVHRIAVAVDLGDLLLAAERGPGLDTRTLPVERRAALLIGVGRTQEMLGRDAPTLSSLLEAEALAPQLVRHATSVRESVRGMYRRAGHAGASTPLMRFAERCRAVA